MSRLLSGLLLVGLLAAPSEARTQIVGGVFGAYAQDSFDGTPGLGAQLGIDVPILPLDVYGAGTWFFPECDDCELKGWSVGVTLRPFLFPIARPYVVGGLTARTIKDSGTETDSSGPFAGIGLDVALAGFRVFAEGRYEFLDGPLEQGVARVGLLFF